MLSGRRWSAAAQLGVSQTTNSFMTRAKAQSEVQRLASDVASLRARTQEGQAVRSFILGGLYALDVALALRFGARSYAGWSRPYENELTRIAKQLGARSGVQRGKWAAGFYFNSSLQHFAGAYHRLLKLVTSVDNPNVPCLAQIAIAQGKVNSSQLYALTAVHRDVNGLKHEARGLLKGRRVADVQLAVQAADEAVALLKMIV